MGRFTKTRAKGLLVAAAIGLAVPGSLFGSALGHTFDAASSVTIRQTDVGFAGRVSSEVSRCAVGRIVVVKRRVPDGPDKTVGTASTNDRGRYRVRVADPMGRYYAKVIARRSTGYAHSHVCEAARSNAIRAT